jgi:hypothetical protein
MNFLFGKKSQNKENLVHNFSITALGEPAPIVVTMVKIPKSI